MSDPLVHEVPGAIGTAVLLHGMGLGPWLWEAWLPSFTEARLSVVAPRFVGHGDGRDAGFADLVAQAEGVLDGVQGPISLVGHSVGGLVAQVIATRRELHALVLVCPMLPRSVRFLPDLRGAARLAPMLLRRQPVLIPWDLYREHGLGALPEPRAREAYDRIVAWPNRVLRDLVRPPEVDPAQLRAPTLVAIGKQDRVIPWRRARVLGDLYEAVVWRYDDLGHLPQLEPAGARMGRDIAKFAAEPHGPRVIESEAFGPDEGVGHEARAARRGEAMKKRSAYGQRASAR